LKIDLTLYKPEACVSKDATRPHLTRAYYDPEKKRICASDGYFLVVIPVTPSKGDTEGYLPDRALEEAREAQEGSLEATVLASAKAVDVVSTGTSYTRPDGGKFPDVDAVMKGAPRPGEDGCVTFGIDAELLRILANAIGAARRGQHRNIRITVRIPKSGKDMSDPVYIDAHGGASAGIGLLMPPRI
jgi:hypothetical protein